MNYLQKKKLAMLNSIQSGGRLPSEYQEVEWIESSGTQYIMTSLYAPDDFDAFEFDGIFVESNNAYNLNGTCGGGIYPYFSIGIMRNGSYYGGYGNPLKEFTITTFITYEFGTRLIWYICNGLQQIKDKNGTVYGEEHITNTISKRNPQMMFGWKPSVLNCIRIYNQKFFLNNVITGEFVPCYRKSDGVIGMYDLYGSICPLTNTPFYINSGTGTFTKGPDV